MTAAAEWAVPARPALTRVPDLPEPDVTRALGLMREGVQVRSIAVALGRTAQEIRDAGIAHGWTWSPAERRMIREGMTLPPPHEGARPARHPGPAAPETLARIFGIFSDTAAGDLAWMDDGLCAETDPEAFFPEKGGSTREAKMVCRSCEVRAECLEYALERDERFGIWGGLSERERRRLKRQRA